MKPTFYMMADTGKLIVGIKYYDPSPYHDPFAGRSSPKSIIRLHDPVIFDPKQKDPQEACTPLPVYYTYELNLNHCSGSGTLDGRGVKTYKEWWMSKELADF